MAEVQVPTSWLRHLGKAGLPRRFLPGAALAAVVAAAVWATTPPSVPPPAPQVWARCFEPTHLPVAAEQPELALFRHGNLEDGGNEPPVLVVSTDKEAYLDVVPDRQERGGVSGGRRAGPTVVLPDRVEWAARLEKGRVEVRRADGGRFLVDAGAGFRLDAAETYTARLVQPRATSWRTGEARALLAADAKLEIVLPDDRPVIVRHSERLSASPFVVSPTRHPFSPDIRPNREAAPHLAARLAVPGLDFDKAKAGLRACLWLGEGTPQPVSIATVGAATPGVADLVLGLPSEPFPWLNWRRGRQASLAVVTNDGTFAGTGSFVYPSGAWALLLATGFAVLLFFGLIWVGDDSRRRAAGPDAAGADAPGAGIAGTDEERSNRRKAWLMGLFIGEDGQPSLSLFQILLWTIITAWALLFVFFNTGNLLMLTQQVMILLGFAGAGSLAARWVAASRQPVPGNTTGRAPPVPRFWAVIENERGLDLFKLQLLVFTVLIAAYVAFRVVRQSAFPELENEFLLLMGVSNGLYVGSKVVQASPFAQTEALKVQWDVLRLRVEDLEKDAATLEAEGNDLAAKVKDAATKTPPDAAEEQRLAGRKALVHQEIAKQQAQLAQARDERDKKEQEYKTALAALTKT